MVPPIPGLDVCFSPFDSEPIQQVPIVRIWGATPAGQNTCLHLHRVNGFDLIRLDKQTIHDTLTSCAHTTGAGVSLFLCTI